MVGMFLLGIFLLSVIELFFVWGDFGVVIVVVVGGEDGWVDLVVFDGVCVVVGMLFVVLEVFIKGVEVWNDEFEFMLDVIVVVGKFMNV